MKQVYAILAGCGAIVLAVVMVGALQPEPTEIKPKSDAIRPVTVQEVSPSIHNAQLKLLATTSARWPIQLKASSNAQLIWLNPDITPGSLIKKGQKLAQLNTNTLKANVAQAYSELKQSELNLKQELHEQTVALSLLSAKTASSYARREPQVLAAKARLKQAQQALVSAKTLLSEANIIAPFDAIVLQKQVSPGEWVTAGQSLFELAASDTLDVELPVSERHWQHIQPALNNLDMSVSTRSGTQWNAQLRYVEPMVDKVTRQRQFVLFVKHPYQGDTRLLPNQQVSVYIALGRQPNVAKIKACALTRDGYVWTLDAHNRLQKEWVDVVEAAQELVYVRFKHNSERRRRVVIYPLLSMLSGQQVSPVIKGLETAQ